MSEEGVNGGMGSRGTAELLRAFTRKVVAVPLTGRADLQLKLLTLTVAEEERSIERLRPHEGRDIVYQLLADHVCDNAGDLLLSFEQAKLFTEKIYGEDLTAIMTEIHKVRGLNKQSLENTEKN